MAAKINEQVIESQYVEYGVEYTLNGGLVVMTDDIETETGARWWANILEGKVVARTVYETAWAEVSS